VEFGDALCIYLWSSYQISCFDNYFPLRNLLWHSLFCTSSVLGVTHIHIQKEVGINITFIAQLFVFVFTFSFL
jgi:hypothetical protein